MASWIEPDIRTPCSGSTASLPQFDVGALERHVEAQSLGLAPQTKDRLVSVVGCVAQELDAAEVDRRLDLRRASTDGARLYPRRDSGACRRRPERVAEAALE